MCGMMRPRDVAEACRLGADAVGVILHAEARRRITLEHAAEVLSTTAPWVARVGVFVNAPVEFVQHAASLLRLDAVQLHGEESDEYVRALYPLAVTRVIRVMRGAELEWPTASQPRNVAMVLLDSPSGGSGMENDFAAIAAARSRGQWPEQPPVALAGGLRPDNVEEAIRMVRPYAVDVSSGIETEFGQKDPDLVRRFVEAVRRADAAMRS